MGRPQLVGDTGGCRQAHIVLSAGGVADKKRVVSVLYFDLVGNSRHCDVLRVRRSRGRDCHNQAERRDACEVQDATTGRPIISAGLHRLLGFHLQMSSIRKIRTAMEERRQFDEWNYVPADSPTPLLAIDGYLVR